MDASAQISVPLLAWYDQHARTLPWRSKPGSPPPDPYRVWLSEVMLQQTTVAAVVPYFSSFTQRWPRVTDLAAARDDEVMAAWAGLGYYARARNLLACARVVAGSGGVFPGSEAELLRLPGVGTYTAAAIAAIAFGLRAVVIDANVERVVSRLFAIAAPMPAARAEIRRLADTLTPQNRAGDYAQALMDLGATVCTARQPRCAMCPIAGQCLARKQGEAERFPVKPLKAARPQRKGRAFWIEREGKVWLVQREGKGMLGGMRALPDDGWSARSDGKDAPPLPGPWEPGGSVSHIFTHFALGLHVSIYRSSDWHRLNGARGEWWPIKQLDEAGLPTLFAKVARRVLAERESR